MVTSLNWPSTLPGDPSVSLGSTLFWSLQLPFQTAYFLQAPSFSPIFFCTIRRQQKTLLSTLRKLNQIIQKGISWEIPQAPAIKPTSLSAFGVLLSFFLLFSGRGILPLIQIQSHHLRSKHHPLPPPLVIPFF